MSLVPANHSGPHSTAPLDTDHPSAELSTMRNRGAADDDAAPVGDEKKPSPPSSSVSGSSGTDLITAAHVPRLLLFFGIGSVLTLWFAGAVHDNKDIFQYGDLYAGQLMACLFGFTVLAAGFAFYAAVAVAMFTQGATYEEAQRRFLDPASVAGLNAAIEFVGLLGIFFLCDRTTIIPRSKKAPNKDTFWFIWALLMIAAFFTLRKAKPPAPKPALAAAEEGHAASALVPVDTENFYVKWLQREQTEEWKGWMQVMFLWYHYFEAKELYNVIRLYIAAYVWMTGFGNFSYYYIRKDFTLERFCQMQWRLNFLVLWVCLILANEYMLYYINMLHTYFTLLIYIGLGVASHMNVTSTGVAIKFGILATFCLVMWDVKGVFETVWAPFTWLVQYHDPYKPDRPLLHEWQFRSGLDHLVWIVGMLTAFNHPNVDKWMVKVDSMGRTGTLIKSGIAALLCAVGYWYVETYLLLPKKEYNAIHPFTSFIPITLYILLRNLFPIFRQYHLHLFEYLGKITLETYIAQFHVWMATTGINGSPKRLLRVLPEGYPLLNFVVMSGVFFIVSMRLFHNTNSLKNFVLPPKSSADTLRRNLVIAGCVLGVSYLWSLALNVVAARMAS